MNYGLQMYSVRDITGTDLAGALKQVADLGYSFVEFAGFFGHSAQDVKKMLDDNGLTVSGTHTGWQELTAVREGRVHTLDKGLYSLKPNERWAEAYEHLVELIWK